MFLLYVYILLMFYELKVKMIKKLIVFDKNLLIIIL